LSELRQSLVGAVVGPEDAEYASYHPLLRFQCCQYRNWQWTKHLALADYVVPWAAKLGSIARTIFIVDLFAGGARTCATVVL
jgi:hypothetical protein